VDYREDGVGPLQAAAEVGEAVPRHYRTPTDPYILLVENDRETVARTVAALTDAGYAVQVRSDSFAGLVAVEKNPPILIVLNWQLPFIDGQIFLAALHAGLDNPPPVLVIDGAGDSSVPLGAGADAVVPAPCDPASLLNAMRSILDNS
jgi:DNA-binding response OmpR family regulator